MIFNISITAQEQRGPLLLPFNYRHLLSSAINAILRKSDSQYSSFFHNEGYTKSRRKLFTFSDIRIPFTPKGDQMLLLTPDGSFRLCFAAPESAEYFIKGFFTDEILYLADRTSRITFKIRKVESVPYRLPGGDQDIVKAFVEPISPLVVEGIRESFSHHIQYISPYEADFVECLINSWVCKYAEVNRCSESEVSSLRKNTTVELWFFDTPAEKRATTFKKDSSAAQKVIGYSKFRLRLIAPKALINLALNSGLGTKNSLGMGCIKLLN